MPEIFRAAPKTGRILKSAREKRSSPRARGYDPKWDRRSAAYRRANPFCAVCLEDDRLVAVAVVDHKFPVQDGGDVHCDDDGLWGLCLLHHGWKARLEDFARRTGQLDLIVRWCDEPETRPQLRGDIHHGPGPT